MINKSTAEQILGSMPEAQRRNIADLLSGKIAKRVRCMSKKCKGRIIGNIYSDGKFRAVANSKGEMHCRASRHRLDGYMGFECWCGNDSRLAAQEKGVKGIENNAVQKSDIEKVFDNLMKKPAEYPVVSGKQEIDGFIIEEIA